MKALLFQKKLKYKKDYLKPKRTGGEALIRVLKTGICNTDIEIISGYMAFKGVLGHEFVGVVEEAEDKAWIGKRVVGEINCSCGQCEYCRQGLRNHCPSRSVLGILGKDGAFAEYITLPSVNLHELPSSVSDLQAVFIEPLAAAFRILEQVDIGPKHKVVVIGAGKLGLLVSQVIAGTDCDLTVIGKYPEKLAILTKKGVKTVLFQEVTRQASASEIEDDLETLPNLSKQSPQVKPYNYCQQFDLCIDCTGSPTGIEMAINLVKPMGKIILKSTFARGKSLNLSPLVVNEVMLLGSRCGPFRQAIKAIEEGSVEVSALVEGAYDLENWKEGFKLASKRGALKVVINLT